MNIEEQTFETIHARLLADIDDSFDKRQGSVVYDLTGPTASEMELAYALMATLIDRSFADTATGSDLDRRVAEQGLTRKPSVKATGSVVFTGTDGFTVDAGTILSTPHGVKFTTDEAATISSGTATATITAIVGGYDGNVDVGTVTTLDGVLTGITGVTNPTAISGGVDEEADAELLARYLEKVSLPATSGNAYHYRQTAKEVSGVSDAKVFPLWNGPGTVRVVITSDDGNAASTALVDAVAEHIEDMRPIGANVTVNAATVVPVTITATVKFDATYSIPDAQTEVTAKIAAYIGSLGLGSGAVRYASIMRDIMNVDGVLDCYNLKINGTVGDLALSEDAAPALAGVNIIAEI